LVARPEFAHGCMEPSDYSPNFAASPFIDSSYIFKHGATTGLTVGYVSPNETSERSFDPNGCAVVGVQWLDDMKFTNGGDSGSLYYSSPNQCIRPVAIHVFANEVEKSSFGVSMLSILRVFPWLSVCRECCYLRKQSSSPGS